VQQKQTEQKEKDLEKRSKEQKTKVGHQAAGAA
jgi:hypothetical protein